MAVLRTHRLEVTRLGGFVLHGALEFAGQVSDEAESIPEHGIYAHV
jgi:hypothetical protein